ncbi:MAG TPA: glycosyltransferase family 4 protein [Candidatus Paceibacterota bacterium]|nr:glycosyltransferase family 4 protein [Candidatus Paceibacterota bacterium]
MKRILITTGIFPPDIGGPASYGALMARHLAARSQVTVLTYSSTHRAADANLPYRVIRVSRAWPKGLRHLLFLVAACFQARRHDVIFSLNAVSAGIPAHWAARLARKKFIVKIVGDYAWETAMNRGKTQLMINDFQRAARQGRAARLHRFQVSVCAAADRVIVPSRYLADLVEGWGIPKEKIAVVYNGVDFTPSSLTKEEARKKLGLTGNILFTYGRLVPWKGFRMLAKLMPRLAEVNQFFQLVIAGDGPDRKTLEAIIKNLGLTRKVLLVGRKAHAEIADYFAAADMFLLNSGYEGFSHQILEAMAAGVPVIASAVGGNREAIVQGENGFLVKYNDEFNLIEAIRSLWNNPELRGSFAREGQKTVRRFSYDEMLQKTTQILI